MKLPKILTVLMVIFFLTAGAIHVPAQPNPGKTYEQMSPAERLVFVGEQARRIAREMSGSEYEFTPTFEEDIQKAVTQYAQRSVKSGDNKGKRVLPSVFERGQAEAPRLIAAFKARRVSPLVGLYIPWIESAYVNIQSPNSMGAVGMFQFLPKTGEHFGLSVDDLLDVEKSADAAARYITDSIEAFKGDPMKEALALLAYNRGGDRVARDLKVVLNDQNKQCSVCALNANRDKLDETFRSESVYYVPLFFAAAIIGENPQAFGLQGPPLSSYEAKR
ncbi:MAG: transglycosylase SLT domain-containing protein [Pyrinomonadaceae bacterium]|nr:transglycosylase SLT domain-containing protein [Pyrinomonadaceae bacterium]